MRPIRVTLSGLGESQPIVPDQYLTPFNLGLSVVLSPGASLTYTVEHTFDDVFAPNFTPATATWFPNATLSNKTASSDGNYQFPVSALRLRVSAYTGGSADFTVLQAGVPGG